jgi:hypothetical protein
MIADSVAGQAKIPHAVRRLLLDALAVRDQYNDLLAGARRADEVIEGTAVEITDNDQPPALPVGRQPPALPAPPPTTRESESESEEMIPAGEDRRQRLQDEIASLQQRIDALIARNPTHAPNRKLLKHLANEQQHLLTFLKTPDVQATNWRAEQAIRPAVVNRKNWGGNRTEHGAEVQQTLTSVIRTSRQQDVCPIELLTDLQLQSTPAPSSMLHFPPATAADPRGP